MSNENIMNNVVKTIPKDVETAQLLSDYLSTIGYLSVSNMAEGPQIVS